MLTASRHFSSVKLTSQRIGSGYLLQPPLETAAVFGEPSLAGVEVG